MTDTPGVAPDSAFGTAKPRADTLLTALGSPRGAPVVPSRRASVDISPPIGALALRQAEQLGIRRDTPAFAAWLLVLDAVSLSTEVAVDDGVCGGAVVLAIPPDQSVAAWLVALDGVRTAAPALAQPRESDSAFVLQAELSAPVRSGLMLLAIDAAYAQFNAAFDPARISPASAQQLLELAVAALSALVSEQTQSVDDLRQELTLDPDGSFGAMSAARAGWTFSGTCTVTACFSERVALHRDRTALVWDSGSMTYAELDRAADRFAARLQSCAPAEGARIALCLDRGPHAVVAMLGILKSGAAYVPIEPGFPAERISFMLADAQCAIAIARTELRALPAGCVALQIDDTSLARAPAEAAQTPSIRADDLAYVMYTSGSTGQPKGVEILNRSIVRLVKDAAFMRLDESVVMLHAAPLGFDASTLEIWGPLLNGGTCVINEEAIPGGAGIARAIRVHHANAAWLTAALFNAIVDDNPKDLLGLRELLTGGEALSVPHVLRALAALPETRLINGYGPTECTTFTTTYAIPRELKATARSVPIGFPINATSVFVLNAHGRPVPLGFVGELHVGGLGLARGYLDRPELTAERFVTLPGSVPPERVYRTGDLVRFLPDGALEYLGRADTQIKIRGYRIELAEIETVLAAHPAVRACAVVAGETADRGLQLIAYVVPASNGTGGAPALDIPALDIPALDVAALKADLGKRLPDFMVPPVFVVLAALPLTLNGKLDRRALPAPPAVRPELVTPYETPGAGAESVVAAVFAQLLQIDRVGRNDSFFELGGSSLLVLRALARLREAGHALSVTDFFSMPTPAALGRRLAGGADGVDPRRLARTEHGRSRSDGAEPIAIIGMAGRFPGASSIEALWQVLSEGRDTIRTFTDAELDASVPVALRSDAAYVRARGVIDDVDQFDPAFFGINPKEAELMDPQQRLFLEVAWECMESAGYAPGPQLGPVGVFAGMYNATYFQRHVALHPELIERIGEFQVMLANEKDYIATRTAHRLNLTGPAISVHTACSTSLVAIAQAVDSLRNGGSAMALAGGASITCPPNSGYLYQDGAMLSPDGHTRTFDINAQGTVFSDGVAAVLLKRLDQAVTDRDTIYAVIRGVAVNNDGGDKASFTAPSVDGQAAVIASALGDAGVDARSLSYVEAHGTATPLGDPVEIEALTRAFRHQTPDVGFCAVGSIKSNLGHTVIAAGATGVIKTTLALQREWLPPNANFTANNPKIPFAGSPFVVADRLRPWPRGEQPRRAGVSSFGVGGTNAHAVLEEAPVPLASAAALGPQLLRLSARTPAALEAMAARLAAALAAQPDLNLADVAYTLRVGRTAFPHRTVVVAAHAADAVVALSSAAHPLRATRVLPERVAGLVFAFPGQGAQYAGMGARLHAEVPECRDAFDACFDALGSAGVTLKTAMFGSDADALKATAVTQPATFCLEYALARFWIEHGVQPIAMIGHSVGEFVAAALAGVLRLEDAVRLVARRGQLMQSMPTGSMLSVRLAAERLLPLLPAELALAAENGPNLCVVSGPTPTIEALQARLAGEGVATSLLQTSHAFHSPTMDGAIAPFEAEIRKVSLSPPKIPIISTLTGALLSDAEATDPGYWARHLRQPVRFSPAVRTMLEREDCAFLEIGPRATLSTLVRQHTGRAGPPIAVASLASTAESEVEALALATGQLWTLGIDVPWTDAASSRRRVLLPTYPFERRRCWVDAVPTAPAMTMPSPVAQRQPSPFSTVPVPAMSVAIPPAAVAETSADRVPALVQRLKVLLEDLAGTDLAQADPAASFAELGLDSLTLTQAALQVKRQFKVDITFRQLMERHRSLQALAEHLDRELPRDSARVAATAPSSAVPVAAPAAGTAGSNAAALEQLIRQQMQWMTQQLALLQSGVAVAPPPATPTAAPAHAPVEPAAETATGMLKYDPKTAFGAIARIHTTRSGEISERSRARLDQFMRRYIERTRKSKDYTVRHRPHLADPRVVNGFRPQLKEMIYQIVIERSKGSQMWDLDGNQYVDALNGFGMSLFGWQPDFVRRAIERQIETGYDIGPQHPLAGDVAKQVCEFTGFDRAGLCNTGSEAVMGTVRIARTVTGRSKIAIFSGSYHGIFDEVIVRATKKLRAYPAAPGIMPNTAENVLVLDYGTPEALEVIKAQADDIAAVLVEPVQSRRPDFQPREFLRELREITERTGIILIFDEVVTGFRCHPGGIQSLWGIHADLASYGKVLGGGFPIGVIAGRREYMDALDGGSWQYGDDSVPTVGVTYFAGTFVRHPLALAAAHASLEHMRAAGPELQSALTLRTAAMADELNAHCREVGAPIVIKHFSSVWKVVFSEDHPLQDLLFAMMRNRGVHILDNFPCFFTTAHTDQDIATIKKAFKEAVAELQEADFLPRRAASGAAEFDAARPPVPGARLGRDADGRPAWFVPNLAAPGKYLKVD